MKDVALILVVHFLNLIQTPLLARICNPCQYNNLSQKTIFT